MNKQPPSFAPILVVCLCVLTTVSGCGLRSKDTRSTRLIDTNGPLLSCDTQVQVQVQTQAQARASGDGEGCARLVGKDHFVAGETTEFIIEFKVGPSGIAVGGAISLGLHHAADWVTSLNKKRPGFVRLRSEERKALELARYNEALPGMFSDTRPGMKTNQIYHRIFVATVLHQPLLPGAIVQFHFGANEHGINVVPYIDLAHEFRLTTDSDGNGSFEAIKQSPVVAILPAPSAALTAVLRSQVVAGVPTSLQVRAEDTHHNLATDYSGKVDVRDEHGTLLLEGLPLVAGLAEASVTLHRLGPHRLRLEDTQGKLSGRSNPLRVFEYEPERKVYWADLHGHTSVSDGLGANANDYFSFGRDVAKLDINALTDHGHFDWPANVKAVQDFYAPGKYVTLLAQEAGIDQDHMNIYYRHDDMPHLARWRTDFAKQVKQVQSQYNRTEINAIAAPHHFAYDRGSDGDPLYPFDLWDGRLMRFVEVYSSHGTSEYLGNPRPLHKTSSDRRKYMQQALAEGLKFGVIAASDNHDSHPGRSIWGRYAGGLAGVWASDLTREAVWQSLHDYATYGTSLDRIYLDFSINERSMGSTLRAPSRIQVNADIIGKTDALQAELLRDNEVIATFTTENGVIDLRYTDTLVDSGKQAASVAAKSEGDHNDSRGENSQIPGQTAPRSHFYYLRVTQDNGERAWSSPIWVELGAGDVRHQHPSD